MLPRQHSPIHAHVSPRVLIVLFGLHLCGSHRVGEEDVRDHLIGPNGVSLGNGQLYVPSLQARSKHTYEPRKSGAAITGRYGVDDRSRNRTGVVKLGNDGKQITEGTARMMEKFAGNALEDVRLNTRGTSAYTCENHGTDDPKAPPGTWAPDQTKLITKDPDGWNSPKEVLKLLGGVGVKNPTGIILYVFNPESFDSVTATINQLNWWAKTGTVTETMPPELHKGLILSQAEGVAAQWSQSKMSWYLLYRSDKKKTALRMHACLSDWLGLN